MLKRQKWSKKKSWAIKWYAYNFIKKNYTIYFKNTLVKNIGLDGSGENCKIDYQINQNGTGNYYMYSFNSSSSFTCPPAPSSAHPSSTGLSLEYECQWWNNGAAGTFINYQTGQTTTWP